MRYVAIFLLIPLLAFAQAHQPFQSQSPAGVVYGVNKDGQQTVEITNVSYQVTGILDTRLLLRITTRTKEVMDDIGIEAATNVEAWPLGVDLKQKPLYTLTVDGVDSKVVDGALITVLRGLEETEWWSVYKLGTGEKLFDTYTPLLAFSIRRDIQSMRYVGFDVPEKDPHLVGVLIYASAERVLREALITSDEPKQAQMMRSFADANRSVALVETPVRALQLSISQNYPAPPATVSLIIPIVRGDLDLAHAQTPAHLHVAALQR